jgi:hypothetical protein
MKPISTAVAATGSVIGSMMRLITVKITTNTYKYKNPEDVINF